MQIGHSHSWTAQTFIFLFQNIVCTSYYELLNYSLDKHNNDLLLHFVSLSLYAHFACYWIDVDECNSVDLNACGYGSECQNTMGSFMCPCLDGFNATVDGQCEGNGNLLNQSDVYLRVWNIYV